MSDEDSSPEPEANINAIYLAQFRQHLAQVQAHLAGTDAVPLLPSYLPPAGYWTAEEKHFFFHALSVHSRFRPDLIAACVKTKTILDICAYIDALNNALSRDHSLSPLRSNLECAMEVSDSWVQWEEGNADDLVVIEPKWEEETLERWHEEETIARDLHVETIMAAENGNPTSTDRETWESDRQRIWRQESALKRLDFHQLRVLEGLLRQTESGIANKNPDEVHPEDQESPGIPVLPVSPPPVPPMPPTLPSSAIGDDMIDPVLPLSKSIPVHFLPQLGTDITEATDQRPLPPEPSSLQAENTLSPLPPQSVTFPHPSPEDRSPSIEGDKATGTDLSDLTPASRRRFQKRLYMRRKRAEQRGEEVISNIAKLRPGRKAMERKPPKRRPKSYKNQTKTPSREENEDDNNTSMDVDPSSPKTIPVTLPPGAKAPLDAVQTEGHTAGGPMDCQEHEMTDNSDDDDDCDHQKRHKKSGLTKPYKIKKDFIEHGIDGKTLVEGNLGLFNLSTLGRFMKLYKSGYDKSTTTAATAISADTIRLLTVIVEEFTSEVVHRTIISREQDKKMKGDIKVYGRSHDEITPENVEYVLDMMGMRGLTKEKYFAQLLGENASGTSEVESDAEEQQFSGDDIVSNNEERGSSVEGSEGDQDLPDTHQSTAFPALLPLHRELHPPLIHLPDSLSISMEVTSTSEDFCMPVHTDEEDLQEELEEEHDLDEADSLLELQYEVDLWKQFGLKHKHKKTSKGTGKRARK